MTISFAVLLAGMMIYNAIHPSPHPLIPIKPGEEGGVMTSRELMGLVFLYLSVQDDDWIHPAASLLHPLPEKPSGALVLLLHG